VSIVASSIAKQIDLGAAWFVVEHHTDDDGKVHEWRYAPSKSADLNAKLAEHAVLMAEQLAEREADEVIG
jgi:hypothetical protein